MCNFLFDLSVGVIDDYCTQVLELQCLQCMSYYLGCKDLSYALATLVCLPPTLVDTSHTEVGFCVLPSFYIVVNFVCQLSVFLSN